MHRLTADSGAVNEVLEIKVLGKAHLIGASGLERMARNLTDVISVCLVARHYAYVPVAAFTHVLDGKNAGLCLLEL